MIEEESIIVKQDNKLKSLYLLDFSKCDYISDEILFLMSKIYNKVTFVNYYGDDIVKNKKLYKY